MKELDQVILISDRPQDGLKAGDVGTVVHVYPSRRTYEVEFMTMAGDTLAVIPLEQDAIRTVTADDVAHVRSLRGAA